MDESESYTTMQRFEEINLHDEITVLAKTGRDNRPIGRLADGRVILFSKDTTFKISPGETVIGEVVHISGKYLIVKPQRVLGDTTEAMLENLRNVTASGYYQHAVLAKGLLFLISKALEG